MPEAPLVVQRPERWDASFDPDMTEAEVDRILSLPPFKDMDAKAFAPRIPLRGIILHDTRIRRFGNGEIIVRQGDYGTSAFMIISGSVDVVLRPGLPASMLGRRESKRKGPFRMMAQLWSSWKHPESFNVSKLKQDKQFREERDQDEVRVFLQDIPRVLQNHKTETMGPGEFFGEMAALSRMPRAATIYGKSDEAELIEIRWQGLRDLMRYDGTLRAHVDRIYRERALAAYLRSLPLFAHLSDLDLQKVREKTEFATYGEYDWSGKYKKLVKSSGAVPAAKEPVIAEEGDYPNGVIMIRAGFARVTQRMGHGHRTLNYLGAGQYYGLAEIVHNWRRPEAPIQLQNTLRVIGYTHLLIIPTSVMEGVVLPGVPKGRLPPPMEPTPSRRVGSAPNDATARIGPDLLEFLTENRFFNGTAAMVLDLDRCTRCDDCVRACASTHDNNPRFLRHGPASGNIMVANACMHCADPVCMIGCPTGAIAREVAGGQVVINPLTCIGCEACFRNCPYDAIRMVEIRDENGAILLDNQRKPILKATKCDLCVEQIGGPACQRACPHGALLRVNLNDLDTFAPWLKR
ncbi:MAG: 4Fe-4S dicluster domain-containing protein [Verrucomicrobia bacterium]|nr:4Fe-4S dicluster domain-containing protein [Verrucomicrobiota bacterium]